MADTDSTAGEPAEPVELPTHQAETPEQQKEFDLGFEYGMELLRLENKLDLLNADIHSLKYPLGNPEKNLERVAQRKELEDKAAEVQRRIDFIRQWFATKPANLEGIPTDIGTPPADTALDPSDAALGKHHRKRLQNFGKIQAEAKQEVREQEWQRWRDAAKKIQSGKTKPVSKRRMAELVKDALHLPDSIEAIRKHLK